MKKLLLFTGLGMSLGLCAQWSQVSNFGGSGRYAASDFVVSNQAFVTGGLTQSGSTFIAYDELWKYNPNNDSWSKQANYPVGGMWGGISFVVDSIAYVGLGADKDGNQNNQLWAYNPATDQWTQKASFPGTPRNHAFSFALNGKGYIGGGAEFVNGNRIYKKDFWEYNPVNDTWTVKSSYPGSGAVGQSAFIIDGKGYTGMGDDGTFFYNDFYCYEPSTDTWTPKASFPGNNRSFYKAIAAAGKGFVIGGENSQSGFTNQTWSYDALMDDWNREFDFASTPRAAFNLFYLNGTIYLGLGLIGNGQVINDFWSYDFNVGSAEISKKPPFNTYPNPTSGRINVKVEKTSSSFEVYLSDSQGQLIYKGSYLQGMDLITLDPQIPAGVYFLEIRTDSNDWLFRILRE